MERINRVSDALCNMGVNPSMLVSDVEPGKKEKDEAIHKKDEHEVVVKQKEQAAQSTDPTKIDTAIDLSQPKMTENSAPEPIRKIVNIDGKSSVDGQQDKKPKRVQFQLVIQAVPEKGSISKIDIIPDEKDDVDQDMSAYTINIDDCDEDNDVEIPCSQIVCVSPYTKKIEPNNNDMDLSLNDENNDEISKETITTKEDNHKPEIEQRTNEIGKNKGKEEKDHIDNKEPISKKGTQTEGKGDEICKKEEEAHPEGTQTEGKGDEICKKEEEAHPEGTQTEGKGDEIHKKQEEAHLEGTQTEGKGDEIHKKQEEAHPEGTQTKRKGDEIHKKQEEAHPEGTQTEGKGDEICIKEEEAHPEGTQTKGKGDEICKKEEEAHPEGTQTEEKGDEIYKKQEEGHPEQKKTEGKGDEIHKEK